ncbi:MAG: T9SS type A sorting domain-containing protein [Bacteroidetes bacterium]|nr:T9SS type A sorting domain-containing protein [Bacteroidota bacterium]
MKKALLLILFIFSIALNAQRIQNFNAFVAGTSVGIRFTITKGPQCSGYTIYHSLDSVNFVQIYDNPGICGDANANQEISFTHSGASFNQNNYYKAEIFSPYESSPIIKVFVTNQPKPRMLTYPNPVVNTYDVLGVKIFNVSNVRLIGYLYNQYGKPLREYDLTTKLDVTSVDVYDLSNGLYILWLTDGKQAFSSKFVINR